MKALKLTPDITDRQKKYIKAYLEKLKNKVNILFHYILIDSETGEIVNNPDLETFGIDTPLDIILSISGNAKHHAKQFIIENTILVFSFYSQLKNAIEKTLKKIDLVEQDILTVNNAIQKRPNLLHIEIVATFNYDSKDIYKLSLDRMKVINLATVQLTYSKNRQIEIDNVIEINPYSDLSYPDCNILENSYEDCFEEFTPHNMLTEKVNKDKIIYSFKKYN